MTERVNLRAAVNGNCMSALESRLFLGDFIRLKSVGPARTSDANMGFSARARFFSMDPVGKRIKRGGRVASDAVSSADIHDQHASEFLAVELFPDCSIRSPMLGDQPTACG
jgi:hypothetical protein